MNDAMFAVQEAIYSTLAASVEIPCVLGNPPQLYDDVQPDATLPYAAFGGFLGYGLLSEIGFGSPGSFYTGGAREGSFWCGLLQGVQRIL
jgi:hypothetical protein